MKLYLDNSFLNRPFDDPGVKLNRLEAELLFLIIGRVKSGEVALVNSSIIEYENSLNPFPERKIFVQEIMKLANFYQNLNDQIKKRALKLKREMNLSPIDSLHAAAAEFAKVDFLVTCDYSLIKKYRGDLHIIKPIRFINQYENRY